jgi:hypothetical protein
VAASPAETEALLTTLTSHVVEVTQTRLINVSPGLRTDSYGMTITVVGRRERPRLA